MIVTELYKGQGLGNQLACYVTTRVIAKDNGYDFGIQSPENFKGADFFDLDFGRPVIGGSGPEGGPPKTLPEGITNYYRERELLHPTGADIRMYDKELIRVPDGTKIDGLMQGEEYIAHRRDEIQHWLKVKEEYECFDYADENTCIINFRGGEYARVKEFFLDKKYWQHAVREMLRINKNFRFVVITDDVFTAKKFFPHYDVFHFSIAKDYVIIKNAKYLILSNSSFAWFPAWLNDDLRFCIAPKYWARHNISDGYWSLGYNITKGWYYMDREGVLSDYDTCMQELHEYLKTNATFLSQSAPTSPVKKSMRAYVAAYTPVRLKNFIKSIINEVRHVISYIRRPFDLMEERKRNKAWLSKIEVAEYRKRIKIYDVFNFFNELETLEIRLNILNDHVDYFVLVESTMTHSGVPKELFYEKHKHLFKAFEHKIIHFIIDTPLKDFEDAKARLLNPNTPEIEKTILTYALSSDNIPPGDAHYLRDFYEKESVKKPLIHLHDNDFCFVSDLDEIWNPEVFIDYSKDDIYKFKQDAYVYYLNNRSNEDWEGWCGTIATKYKNIKNSCLNHLRTARKTKYTVIRNGGWHFTFQGGPERVKNKIESYSYHEINTEDTRSKIESMISENKDIKGRYIRFWKDESKLPQYLLKNKEKYKELFK
jgi:hypothetical protein